MRVTVVQTGGTLGRVVAEIEDDGLWSRQEIPVHGMPWGHVERGQVATTELRRIQDLALDCQVVARVDWRSANQTEDVAEIQVTLGAGRGARVFTLDADGDAPQELWELVASVMNPTLERAIALDDDAFELG